jgi:hypothetical protein
MLIKKPIPIKAATSGTFSKIYRSDLAYWAGLVVIWELLVILVALWAVPFALAGASSVGPLVTQAAVLGAGA